MSPDPTRSLPPDPDPTRSAAPPDGPTADYEPAGTAPGPDAPAGSDVTSAAAAGPPAGLPHVPGYELFGELGRGGMGVVYRGRETALNRPVALKMVLAGPYADPATRARFLLEAESVAAVRHPHVVQVYAFGEHAGHPYLAMEHLPGGTLADRVRAAGPLPPAEAAAVAATLADATAAAHAAGVIHRDLKPANVLLTETGAPKVTDFGLAKVGRSDMTATGAVLGTPSYMAPEQAAGRTREVGTAADVYGLGAILYDLLTARPPFKGDSQAATLQLVLTADPTRPRAVNAAVPRDLETICLKCLEKEPGKRYPTAAAVADDLRRFLGGEPVSARPVGRADRAWRWCRRNPAVAALLAAVLVVFAAGTSVSAYYAVEAGERAQEADDNAKKAGDREKDATNERNKVLAEQAKVLAEQKKLAAEQDRTRRVVYLNQMNNAAFARAGGRTEQVHRWLAAARPAAGEPDLRGWEWHYLDRLTRAEFFTFPIPSPGPDLTVLDYQMLTPDGGRVVVRSRVGGEVVLDVRVVATGRSAGEVRVPVPAGYEESKVNDTSNLPAISPDGSHVALAVPVGWTPPEKKTGAGKQPPAVTATQFRLRVWDVTTGKEAGGPAGEFTSVTQLCVGPRADWLAWLELPPGRKRAPAGPGGNPPGPARVYTVGRWDRKTGLVTRHPVQPPAADEPGATTRECALTADGRSVLRTVDRSAAAKQPGGGFAKQPNVPTVSRMEVWDATADPPRRRWHTDWADGNDVMYTYSLGGRSLLVTTGDGFRVHRLDDGAPVWTAVLPADVGDYAFYGLSDDGTRALAKVKEQVLVVLGRDGADHALVTELPGRNPTALFPLMAADGKVVIAPPDDGPTVRVWRETRYRTRLAEWKSAADAARVVVSPDFRLTAELPPEPAGGADKGPGGAALLVRDLASGSPVGAIEPPEGYRLRVVSRLVLKPAAPDDPQDAPHERISDARSTCSFSPDGRLLLVRYQQAAGAADPKVTVYDTTGLRPVASWDVGRNRTHNWLGPWVVETYAANAERGPLGETTRVVRDPRTGEILPAFPPQTSAGNLVPDPTGERLAEITGATRPLPGRWSRDPDYNWAFLLRLSGGTDTIRFDNLSAERKSSLRQAGEKLGLPPFPDTGEWTKPQFLDLWERTSVAQEKKLGPVVPVTDTIGVRVRDARTGREVWARPDLGRVPGGSGGANDPIFSPDGRWLAVRLPGTVWVGRAADGADVHRLDLPPEERSSPFLGVRVWFAPDGRRLAAAVGREVRVWDVETGSPVCRLTADEPGVGWAMFTPDGSRLLTRPRADGPDSPAGPITVWDLATARELITVPLPAPRTWPGLPPDTWATLSPFIGDKFYLRTGDGVWVYDGTPVTD